MTTRKLGSWPPGTGRTKRELFTTVIALALIASIALPATAAADESYFRLKDIEIQYLNLWEEPAIASNYGESPHTAKVWVEVEVKQPKKLKVGIYD